MAVASHQQPEPRLTNLISSYLSLNFSILPLLPSSKAPYSDLLPVDQDGKPSWGIYRLRRATTKEALGWVTANPKIGVGILAGAASGNLFVLDADFLDFSDWLKRTALIQKTWTVLTGSGKIHVYFRTDTPMPSSVLKLDDGTVLADLRGEGEYVAAPPTLHPSGVEYQTLAGSPSSIARLSDVSAFLQRIVQAYKPGAVIASTGGTVIPFPTNSTARSKSIQPPAKAARKREILQNLRAQHCPYPIIRALEAGTTPGRGYWHGCQSDSDADWIICKELIRLGLTDADIEEIYASFRIGAETYQNTGRPNHGAAYLQHSLGKARAWQAQAQIAMATARGKNFVVTDAAWVLSDEKSYWRLHVDLFEKGTKEVWEIRIDDTKTEVMFRMAVLRQTGTYPEMLPGINAGEYFYKFTQALSNMAARETLPDDATMLGQYRQKIVEILSSPNLVPSRVPASDAGLVGFHSVAQGLIYFRGTRLINELSLHFRPPPTPERVWQVVKSLAGKETRVKIWDGTETFWCIPDKMARRG